MSISPEKNESAEFAVIGGTGVGALDFDEEPRSLIVTTPWGEAAVTLGSVQERRLAFLPRHGAGHRLPPHRINFRANIAALAQLGVRAVFATTAVGSLRHGLRSGDLVLLSDFIDFTQNRADKTFFDQPGQVVHTDFSVPYSAPLRAALLQAAVDNDIAMRPTGTYLCADGPRYESPAEVRLFARWGADVVGMTGIPEATLAREANLHYAGISLVTNPGAGLTPLPVDHAQVEIEMARALPRLRTLLLRALARVDLATLPAVGPGAALPGAPRLPERSGG